jgi:hypothetical protein
MGRGHHIFELLAGENVGGGEVAFGVAVLSGLGDGDVQDLAGLSLDHDEAALECNEKKWKSAEVGRGVRDLSWIIIIALR